VPCPFGASLSADLTAFGCASDPLGAPINQISAGSGAVITGPVGSISAAQTVTHNATSGTGGVGGGVSSSAGCLGAAGSGGAGDLFGRGGC
jgi:hypothetical protein